MMQSRTYNCNELRSQNIGEKVTLAGWYDNLRRVSKNLGFLILRDFYGTTQVVIETEELMQSLEGVNNESTLSIEGTVRERSNKNPNLPTGDIEVVPEKISVLGSCRYNALPFEINRSKEADENLRLKYRYLDLRNPEVKNKIVLRSQIVAELRKRMTDLGFLEITTPILTCSSPEGARDYIVPSRVHPGKFYALPQAPQQFKQILMASGFDRYFQALCRGRRRKKGKGALRRGKGPLPLIQDDDQRRKLPDPGRTHQPPGYGIHHRPEQRPDQIPGRGSFCLPRPPVCSDHRQPHHGNPAWRKPDR